MTQHTPASLADVLERDYFPMPDGKNLYLNEYEWRMVVEALRCYEAEQSLGNDSTRVDTAYLYRLEQDAARYRWLRDIATDWQIGKCANPDLYPDYGPGELDSEIDAAMSAQSDT